MVTYASPKYASRSILDFQKSNPKRKKGKNSNVKNTNVKNASVKEKVKPLNKRKKK